jgi:uncharacterized membrane protein
MKPRAREAHVRSIVKAISWRATGSIDTFLISWFVTGHSVIAVSIAGTELGTKVALYYLHERAWSRIPWGTDRRHPAVALSQGDYGTTDTSSAIPQVD